MLVEFDNVLKEPNIHLIFTGHNLILPFLCFGHIREFKSLANINSFVTFFARLACQKAIKACSLQTSSLDIKNH